MNLLKFAKLGVNVESVRLTITFLWTITFRSAFSFILLLFWVESLTNHHLLHQSNHSPFIILYFCSHLRVNDFVSGYVFRSLRTNTFAKWHLQLFLLNYSIFLRWNIRKVGFLVHQTLCLLFWTLMAPHSFHLTSTHSQSQDQHRQPYKTLDNEAQWNPGVDSMSMKKDRSRKC